MEHKEELKHQQIQFIEFEPSQTTDSQVCVNFLESEVNM